MDLGFEINHLTLQEAINQLRQNQKGLMAGNDENAKRWFLNHDATHVIFGTIPFDLRGESLNDLWTIMGSTVTIKEYMEFFKFSSMDKVMEPFVKKYGSRLKVGLAVLKVTPDLLKVLLNTRRLTKKWPWDVKEDQLNKRVGDLRKEFNISLI